MKRLGLIIILIGFAFSAIHAQTEQQNTLETEKTDVASPEMVLSEDSLSVPLASPVSFSNQLRPFGMYGITPFDYNFATWELHKGFNASIGLNVTFSPSKWPVECSRRTLCNQHGLGFPALSQCRLCRSRRIPLDR